MSKGGIATIILTISSKTILPLYFIAFKCPLGLQFLNPNKAADMAQILEDIQNKYVPKLTTNGGETEVLQRVIFDGDQLTEERARNCQWANKLARTQIERLEGITPSFADWHLKKMFLGVCEACLDLFSCNIKVIRIPEL